MAAEIPGFEGIWANGKTVEECRRELIEVLEEWLILKIKDKDPNASVVTRYPENFKKLLEAYPEDIAKEYLKNTEKVLQWLRQNERLK